MATHIISLDKKRFPSALIQRMRTNSPALTLLVLVNIGLLGVGLMGMLFDPRTVLGANTWAKTTKFAISISAYGATLLWMLSFVKSRPKLARFVGVASGALLLFETALIVLQGARATPLHFNSSTVFDGLVYSALGIGIAATWFVDLIGAVVLLREKMPNPTLATGLRLGLFMALIGAALAFGMTIPNATQMVVLESGASLDMIGAHNVNALIDGQTRMIPFLGWNMDGGDLRIAHFVGLHGMQIIPLMTLAITRLTKISVAHQIGLVWVAAVSYLGVTFTFFWQALRNQSIIAPDSLTLAVLFGGMALAIIAALAIYTHGKRQNQP